MSRSTRAFDKLIAQIDRTPVGITEHNLLADAVMLAIEIDDEDREYRARMRQISSANTLGVTDVMLNSFAWCLARHDADPARFPNRAPDGSGDLLWYFKWVSSSLIKSPAFSDEQISELLDDMERRYRQAGIGLHGVLICRMAHAGAAGRWEEAERLRVQLEATPRDDYSDCEACVSSYLTGYLADTGRDEEAVRRVDEMIAEGHTCSDEPEYAISRTLIPLLRMGRADDARQAHLRSYRLSKDKPTLLDAVANNIVFAATTGNAARALALTERHLGWLAHDGLAAAGHHSALSAFAFALDRVSEAGHGGVPVKGADAASLTPFLGEHEGAWTVDELASAAWAAAERIGAEFDRRDAGDAHARWRETLRTIASEHYDVPIHAEFIAADPPPVPPAPDSEAWVQRVFDLVGCGAFEDALEAASHVTQVEDPRAQARIIRIRINQAVEEQRWKDAEALIPDRQAALREGGRDDQAAFEERVGLAAFGRYEPEDAEALEREWAARAALPALTVGDLALRLAATRALQNDQLSYVRFAEEAVRACTEADDEEMVIVATLTLAHACLTSATPDRAQEIIEQILSRSDLKDPLRIRALDLRARSRAEAGEFSAAAADADETIRLLTMIGARRALADHEMFAGSLWETAGDRERGIVHYRTAVRLRELYGGDVAEAKLYLGRALLDAAWGDEAAETLDDALRLAETAEAPGLRIAEILLAYGQACTAVDALGPALSALGRARDLFAEHGMPVEQVGAMTLQARIFASVGEMADATELLEEAEAIVRGIPDAPEARASVLHLLGQFCVEQDAGRAFALFDEVTAIAAEHDARWTLADVTDSRGRALASLGRVDEAVAALLTAADSFAEAGDIGAAAGSELCAARVLADAGRDEEAVPVFRGVIDRSAEAASLRQVAALELGDAFDRLGRPMDAAQARTLAEN